MSACAKEVKVSDLEVKTCAKHDGRVAVGVEAKPRSKLPALADNIPCPRCNSTKTKFCYYNNYNLKQPRYLCKVVSECLWTCPNAVLAKVSPFLRTDDKLTILFRDIIQSCQRYWTLGGLTRQVPPGAGKRKQKKSRRASKQLSSALKESELDTINGSALVNSCAPAVNFSMPMSNVSQDCLGVGSYLVPHSYSGDQDLPGTGEWSTFYAL